MHLHFLAFMFQLARHQDKLVLLQQSLETTQDELSARVREIVLLEQTQRKLNSELKTVADRVANCNDEIADKNHTIGGDTFHSLISFSHGTGTLRCLQKEMATYRHGPHPCGETQTMSHIVESCPVTKLNGGLSRLHSAGEDAVSWLTSYG